MKPLIILIAFIILTAGLTPLVTAAAETDIEFIIDASGSMAALTEGTSQMDIAKKSIKSTID